MAFIKNEKLTQEKIHSSLLRKVSGPFKRMTCVAFTFQSERSLQPGMQGSHVANAAK